MLRLGSLLVVIGALVAGGCAIDRVEWESSGFPVEEVRHALEDEYDAHDPVVECIQREVQGGEYECRAHDATGEYHCHTTTNTPRRRVYELECEAHHEGSSEQGHSEEEPAGDEEAAAEH